MGISQAAREEKELDGVREPSGAAAVELMSPGATASGASPVAPAPEVPLTPPSLADQVAGTSWGGDSSFLDDEAPAPALTPEENVILARLNRVINEWVLASAFFKSTLNERERQGS